MGVDNADGVQLSPLLQEPKRSPRQTLLAPSVDSQTDSQTHGLAQHPADACGQRTIADLHRWTPADGYGHDRDDYGSKGWMFESSRARWKTEEWRRT